LNEILEHKNCIELSHTALQKLQKMHEHRKYVKGRSGEVSIDYQTTYEMDNFLIPAFLQHSYLTDTNPINVLRPWQHELLESREWEAGRNCVAVARLLEEKPSLQRLLLDSFLSRTRMRK
jgi:hypothetical protein